MDQQAISELDRRLGIPGVARVVAGQGGLPKVAIATPTTGEMYLHGGHITAWRPPGAEEVLFVSAQTNWQEGRAIRGGVPICFPWFGPNADDPKAPAHGFVRTIPWTLDSIVQSAAGVTVAMSTTSNYQTKKWWPADFRLVHRVTFGTELTMQLEVTNTGTAPLAFEEALHAYFRVGKIEDVRVFGLSGVRYADKTDSGRTKTQEGPVAITRETDRVYLDTRGPVDVADPALARRLHVGKENSATTVVWNPWIDKSKSLSDFGDNEWPGMLCIEASNITPFAIPLAPGQQHTMTVTVRVG